VCVADADHSQAAAGLVGPVKDLVQHLRSTQADSTAPSLMCQ
jgi:hypothetical protein